MKKGSVVLIPFPFTDLTGSKVRPAVVLTSNEQDVTICFITSELKWKTEHDVFVFPSASSGVKVPSLIRVGKIATIDTSLVLGLLGELSNSEITEINNGLKNLLELH
jgi:mRNA interferase MazF